MKILITGGTGFVGWNAVRYFAERGHDVFATYRSLLHYLHPIRRCQPVELDLADGTAIDEVVARFQPHLILHTAALARPQQMKDLSVAFAINGDASGKLAAAGAAIGCPIVYLSTDLVYSENAGVCNEETVVKPSGAGNYAASKYLGEELVREHAAQWIIIRPTLMYGDGLPGSNSFSRFIEQKWENGEAATVFSDQFRSILYVADLCSAVQHVAIESPQWNELFVCGGPERMSRAEFGLRLADASGVSRSMVQVMKSTELPGYTGGASDITLDSSKLQTTGWNARSLEEGVADLFMSRKAQTASLS